RWQNRKASCCKSRYLHRHRRVAAIRGTIPARTQFYPDDIAAGWLLVCPGHRPGANQIVRGKERSFLSKRDRCRHRVRQRPDRRHRKTDPAPEWPRRSGEAVVTRGSALISPVPDSNLRRSKSFGIGCRKDGEGTRAIRVGDQRFGFAGIDAFGLGPGGARGILLYLQIVFSFFNAPEKDVFPVPAADLLDGDGFIVPADAVYAMLEKRKIDDVAFYQFAQRIFYLRPFVFEAYRR